ncbi:MAG TPA: phosphopantetheine-binding protein [Burkholderiaceae bacterium]
MNNDTLALEAPSPSLVMEVKTLLSDELGLPTDISESEGIFSGGHLQSIDVVTIILLMREKFGVVVRPEAVNLQNFDSISLISQMIERETSKSGTESI